MSQPFSFNNQQATQYFPDESQILTTGSDKKITYWDAFECSAIRELEGSKVGEVNTLDISPDGKYFVTGGGDKVLKLWSYDDGDVVQVRSLLCVALCVTLLDFTYFTHRSVSATPGTSRRPASAPTVKPWCLSAKREASSFGGYVRAQRADC